MTIYMKGYILEDNEELRKNFRDTMEGQFEHDLYIISLSNQLESDETDTLQHRIEWWLVVVDRVAQYLTMFMILALLNCITCIVKL